MVNDSTSSKHEYLILTFKKIFKAHFEIIKHFIEFIVSWNIKFEKKLYKKSG